MTGVQTCALPILTGNNIGITATFDRNRTSKIQSDSTVSQQIPLPIFNKPSKNNKINITLQNSDLYNVTATFTFIFLIKMR